jgi:bisphosphoglycerate-dependent phosphoglycerate mutase
MTPNAGPNAGQYSFNLSLVYAGEIDPKETKAYDYWSDTNESQKIPVKPKGKGCIGSFCFKKPEVVSEENLPTRDFHIFDPLSGTIRLSDLADVETNNSFNSNKMFTFYLVRHGQAEHNLYTSGTIIRKTDTSLTDNGRSGAKEAGKALNDDLVRHNATLQYFFASDLIRTRQTLEGLLGGLDSARLQMDSRANKINLVILPCAHELAFVSNGKCDATVSMTQPFTAENKMACTKLDNYSSNTSQFKDCVSFNCITANGVSLLVRLNWSIYGAFYDKSYRGNTMKKLFGSKKQCRQTSMIEESMKYIMMPNKVIVGGNMKTRKNKKNRKTRKRRDRKTIRK